jgi:hypothetical protein
MTKDNEYTLKYIIIRYNNNFINIQNDVFFTNDIINYDNINYIIKLRTNNIFEIKKIFENEKDFDKFKICFINYLKKQDVIIKNSCDLFFQFRYFYNYIYKSKFFN